MHVVREWRVFSQGNVLLAAIKGHHSLEMWEREVGHCALWKK